MRKADSNRKRDSRVSRACIREREDSSVTKGKARTGIFRVGRLGFVLEESAYGAALRVST